MKHLITFTKRFALTCVTLFLMAATIASAQTAPDLGSTATYGAYTGAGAIENTGLSVINGNLGTNVGSVTGFPPGIYNGELHIGDAATLAAKNDLVAAYNSMNDASHAIIFDTALTATMGNGQVLYPATYGRSDLTTISGDLTFNAMGNPAAIFIIKIRAALNVAKNTRMMLAGGAQSHNIYWIADGAVSVLDNTVYKGNIIANGAIHLYGGSTLEGRALSIVGAVTFASMFVSGPGTFPNGNNLIVVTPAPGDSVRGGTQNYLITWAGTGIAPLKTLEYSLDSGAVWKLIGTTTGDVFNYNWNVPDTISNRALVRVTDANNLRGTSGRFSIVGAIQLGSITVVRPAPAEIVQGGTLGYSITFTAINAAKVKTIELSVDSGAVWSTIGTIDNDSLTYSWAMVPNVSTSKAMIRITDSNGVRGQSGAFTISATGGSGSVNSVSIVGLDVNNNANNNTPLQINWTYTPDIGPTVLVEYSLDNMVTWGTIATKQVAEQPSTVWVTPSTGTYYPVFVRVTGSMGPTRTSAPFSIGPTSSVQSDLAAMGYSIATYPNPAKDQTAFEFVLPQSIDASLVIVNGLGRLVSTVPMQRYAAGKNVIAFNTSVLPAGVYEYVLTAGDVQLKGKLSVIR